MNPALFLVIVLGVTAGAVSAHFAQRRHRGRQVRELASQSNMHYCVADRFDLAPRVAAHLDCPGAANVHVADLVYGIKDDRFRYIFTAEYTRGALRIKRRPRHVYLVTEPKSRSARAGKLQITAADLKLGLIQQYRQLIDGAAMAAPLQSSSPKT